MIGLHFFFVVQNADGKRHFAAVRPCGRLCEAVFGGSPPNRDLPKRRPQEGTSCYEPRNNYGSGNEKHSNPKHCVKMLRRLSLRSFGEIGRHFYSIPAIRDKRGTELAYSRTNDRFKCALHQGAGRHIGLLVVSLGFARVKHQIFSLFAHKRSMSEAAHRGLR